MSQSSKTQSALAASWDRLEAENIGRIEQLEHEVQAFENADRTAREQKTLSKQLDEQDRSLNALEQSLAKAARQFERRFDAISMMDIQPRYADTLRKRYEASELATQSDDFVLYRIIGNDLYPRHRKGQSRDNLRFILENESALEGCKKRWIVNRIADPEEERAILALLEAHQQQWVHIPFSADEYRRIPLDFGCLPYPGYLASAEFARLGPEQRQRLLTALYRFKNNYVMNNNGARNRALEAGLDEAKWVLPWDGNCFLTPRAWNRIVEDVRERPWLAYFAVPMTRVLDNQRLIEDHFEPEAVEEPQLVFRKDARERFNEAFCYGRRPKVELFWRLGIPGKWDRWKDDAWEQPRRDLGAEERQFGVAGWVARLYSGMGSLEKDNQASFKQRGLARQEAIVSTLQWLDRSHRSDVADSERYGVLDLATLDAEAHQYRAGENGLLQRRIDHLLLGAEEALTRGPFTVTDKTTLPPSDNRQDYWHPAPYWWPNPDTLDGTPYIRRDGERVPGTRMYEPESEKYDRTRVQRLFDDGLTLALAWRFTDDDRYADHAIRSLRTFFITPETRMNPHLQFAQVRLGHKKNQGMSTGIIEFKDFYFYLDAVRILSRSPAFTHGDLEAFKGWLTEYLGWLLTSAQGIKECQASNNHGTYYDLQVASIAAFLEHQEVLYETLLRAQSRIACQIAPDGSQPEELTRTTTAHYCCYNLQGWMNLSLIASQWGVDLWQYTSEDGRSLGKATQWLMNLSQRRWPFEQIEPFDTLRFYAIDIVAHAHVEALRETAKLPADPYAMKSVFFPHDGIRPFWNLGQDRRALAFERASTAEIVFAIPLKARAVSQNWEKVVANLCATLRSLKSSANSHYRVVIAGHDRPEIEESLAEGVTFLDCDWPHPAATRKYGGDKRRKLGLIARHIGQQMAPGQGVYLFPLDADDLVDRDLVDWVLRDDNRTGYFVEEGYKLDVTNGRMAESDTFYRRCGSSLIGYFTREELETSDSSEPSYFERWIERGHKDYRHFLMGEQASLIPIPFRPVVYLVNHPDSSQMERRSIKPFSPSETLVDSTQVSQILDTRFAFGREAP